jgi:putative ABC transport system ATP-binding protein
MEAALKTVNLMQNFTSGEVTINILNNINIEINYGELTMLVGPSGCGKTTLISILTGILTPTSGQVFVGSTQINLLSDAQKVIFRRNNIGFVFQQFNLLPTLSAAENAAVTLIAGGEPFDSAVAKAKELLCKLGMEKHSDKLPNQLSGGQQQRVAFARALVHNPKIMVCDEPTASLDGASGKQVMDLLKTVALRKDCAVVVVSHDNRIFHFADRILHMSDGQITTAADNINGQTL